MPRGSYSSPILTCHASTPTIGWNYMGKPNALMLMVMMKKQDLWTPPSQCPLCGLCRMIHEVRDFQPLIRSAARVLCMYLVVCLIITRSHKHITFARWCATRCWRARRPNLHRISRSREIAMNFSSAGDRAQFVRARFRINVRWRYDACVADNKLLWGSSSRAARVWLLGRHLCLGERALCGADINISMLILALVVLGLCALMTQYVPPWKFCHMLYMHICRVCANNGEL